MLRVKMTLRKGIKVLSADIIDNAMLRKVIDKIVVTVEGKIQVYLKLFSDLEINHAAAI